MTDPAAEGDLEVCRRLRDSGGVKDEVTRQVCALLRRGLTLEEAATAIGMDLRELEARWGLWRRVLGIGAQPPAAAL